jgi:hypothetical protein
MGWERREFATWEELRECLNKLSDIDDLVCRGQGAAYDGRVMSCLDRALVDLNDDDEKAKIEREVAHRFRSHAPNYLPYAEQMHLSHGPALLTLMQHYGAPTRLVDWTASIWIGAYFAARSEPEKDGIIYAFNGGALDKYAGEKYGDETENVPKNDSHRFPMIMGNKYGPWVCRLMQMGHKVPRMVAQQGLFTVGGRLGVDHQKAIDDIIPDGGEAPGKLIITVERRLKPVVLKALYGMGINGSTLFPGSKPPSPEGEGIGD